MTHYSWGMILDLDGRRFAAYLKGSRHLGWLGAALGAVIGIVAAGSAGHLLPTLSATSLPWLLAPVGASAVLIFAVPASPLAQPWPVIGGNLLSGLVGLAAGHFLTSSLLAAGIAVGLAIAVMSLARCLHPPGGACALLYALGASGPEHWGALQLLTLTANVLALAGAGWLYNTATGHSWPHRATQVLRKAGAGTHSGQVHDALTAVLAEWDEIIDADIDDLDAIFLAVEQHIRSVEPDAPLIES